MSEKQDWQGTWFDLEPKLSDPETARVTIIPAPFEGSVSYGKGAAQGPYALFQASRQVEFFEPELKINPCQIGISSIPPLSLAGMPAKDAVEKVAEATRLVLSKGKKPVMIGGEHSLSFGSIKACREFFPDLAILHLDAHSDLRESYHGDPFSHASVMKRVFDAGIKFISAGIRSQCREEWELIQANNLQIYYAYQLQKMSGWQELIARQLGENIYLTLDLDVFSPAELPGTGTPEPGGIGYYDLLKLFRAISDSGKSIVGFDLVELAPIPDQQVSEFTAARILYQMIGWFWARKIP